MVKISQNKNIRLFKQGGIEIIATQIKKITKECVENFDPFVLKTQILFGSGQYHNKNRII